MRKIFSLKVILITLACVVSVAILLPAAYFLFVLGVGMGLGEDPVWMHPSTYSGSAPPQWTPDDSEIVFAHGGSIFAAMSDGSSLRLIHGEDGGKRPSLLSGPVPGRQHTGVSETDERRILFSVHG